MHYPTNEFIYSKDNNTLPLETIEKKIDNLNSVEEKKEFIISTLVKNNKNRFHYHINQDSLLKKIYKKIHF